MLHYLTGYLPGFLSGLLCAWLACMTILLLTLTPEKAIERFAFFRKWARPKHPAGIKTEKLAREIIQSIMTCPNDWIQINEYTLDHKSGIKIWIANGVHHVRINAQENEKKIEFSPMQRLYIWKAYLKHENIPDDEYDNISEILTRASI